MKTKYHYYLSSKTEPKHEITRKEFIKLLGESSLCVEQRPLVNGLYMGIADYDKAERLLRNAQRDGMGGTIWGLNGYTLYMEKDRSAFKRSRDSRFPD